jgi:hypothetical protein
VITRILAVLAAIGMIVGAYVYRYGVPGGDGGSGDGGDAGTSGGGAVVVCAEELGAVCDAVAGRGVTVQVESAPETAKRLISARSAAAAGVAGWLAPGPWPAMVDDARVRASKAKVFASKGRGLASTPLVAVARKGQLPSGCNATDVTWRCIGDAGQNPALRIGADPATSSSRLYLRAASLNGLFGNTTWATNDLETAPEDVPDPRTWLGALDQRFDQAAGFGARALESFVLQQGSAQVFLTTGASAKGAPAASFDVRTPSPAVTIAVTYTAAAKDGKQIDDAPVTKALGEAGWTVQQNAKNQGLPSPGVLLALQEA